MAESSFKPDPETMAALVFLMPFAMAGRRPTAQEADVMMAKMDEATRHKLRAIIAALCRRADELAGMARPH
jgi:hypothetical protein